MAKLFHDIRKTGEEADLDRIWNGQDAGPARRARLEVLAPRVQQALLSAPAGVSNIGEWCKRAGCWDAVAALEVPYENTLRDFAIPKDRFQEQKADSRKQGQVDDGIDLQTRLLHLTETGYWTALHAWPSGAAHSTPADPALVLKASTLQGFLKIAQQKDRKRLAAIRQTAEEEGFRHPAGQP